MGKLLSLCMIVKDEEKVLERCLKSVRELVDEIIIVDTGSMDSTKKIAYQYTDKVYDFEWISDFSAARNHAIQRATGQWILVLDADEFVEGDIQEIRTFVKKYKNTDVHGFAVPIYNLMSTKTIESSGLRLFRNMDNIAYISPIHEQLILKAGDLRFTDYSGPGKLAIYHTGYMPETLKEKNKSERNMAIFKTLQSQKKLSPYENFTLANEYSAQRDYHSALIHLKQAYELGNPKSTWFMHCTAKLIHVLVELKELPEAMTIIDTGIQRWEQFSDFYYFKGVVLSQIGLYTEAIDSLKKCIELSQQAGNEKFWVITPDSGFSMPYLLLSEIYNHQLNIPETVTYLTKYLQVKPYDVIKLSQLIHLISLAESSEQTILFLNKSLYSLSKQEDVKVLFKASLLSGSRVLAEHYFQYYKQHESDLTPALLLRHALLTNDREAFQQVLQQLTAFEDTDMNRSIYLAVCLWKEPAFLDYLQTELPNQSELITQLLKKALQDSEVLPLSAENISLLIVLLSDLFVYQHYEAFDWLLNLVSDLRVQTAHSLADFFYSIHQFDIAIDYYSFLFNQQETLKPKSYENIAMLYLAQEEVEDAMDFLKDALEQKPTEPAYYLLILNHSKDIQVQSKYKQLFEHRFPDYVQSPWLKYIFK